MDRMRPGVDRDLRCRTIQIGKAAFFVGCQAYCACPKVAPSPDQKKLLATSIIKFDVHTVSSPLVAHSNPPAKLLLRRNTLLNRFNKEGLQRSVGHRNPLNIFSAGKSIPVCAFSYYPTFTVSIEMDPPSTPSIGNVTTSPFCRLPIT